MAAPISSAPGIVTRSLHTLPNHSESNGTIVNLFTHTLANASPSSSDSSSSIHSSVELIECESLYQYLNQSNENTWHLTLYPGLLTSSGGLRPAD